MPLLTRVPRRDVYDLCLEGQKRCLDCSVCLPFSEFSPNMKKRKGVSDACKKCAVRKELLRGSRGNAAARGNCEHTIQLLNIPTPDTCKYLSIKLDYRPSAEWTESYDAPSLDRIDNTKGYVPGNVQLISNLANQMKRNATIEQLVAFAEGVLRVHKSTS